MCAALFLSSPALAAQANSRAEEIQADRREKAQRLEPEVPSRVERAALYVQERLAVEQFIFGVTGLRVKLGGLVTDSGFALGPEYRRPDLAKGEVVFRVAAQSSFTSYRRFEGQLRFPGFARDKLFFDLYAVHHDYPRLNYFGPGPDSLRTSRTNFRIIDNSVDGALGLRPFKQFNLGISSGYLHVNVGPGRDPKFPSVEEVFSPVEAQGLDVNPSYVRFGAFAQFDFRDTPGGPHSGGNYVAQFSRYAERPGTGHEFRRLDLEIEQYIPMFSKRRVVALRSKSVLTWPDGGQTVPFYLQPWLGGSDDLRGFRSFRFRDANLTVFNAEWRWEVYAGLDMALFGDAGKVFSRHADWDLSDLETSGGFGFRFNVKNNVFIRIDVGFGREGTKLWFKFEDVFGGRPVYSSSAYAGDVR